MTSSDRYDIGFLEHKPDSGNIQADRNKLIHILVTSLKFIQSRVTSMNDISVYGVYCKG